METFLDPSICRNLRDVINSSPIFIEDRAFKNHYNLFCVVMDRIDSCINFLNVHAEAPQREEDFLSFLLFGCMVVDAIRILFNELNIEYNYKVHGENGSYQFFKEICCSHPLNLTAENCPTDDKFFEYIRSLAFAHPYETSRQAFFVKEVQYSPWVIANNAAMSFKGIPDGVGIRIYSNKFDGIKDLCFSFSTLKKYLRSRYGLLERVTVWAKGKLEEKASIWKQHLVNRNQSPMNIFIDIANVLESRFQSHDDIDTALAYLKCETTLSSNLDAINSFRSAIVSNVPAMCDAVDALDYETMIETLDITIHARPRGMHNMAHYQLEKIYGYLDSNQDSHNIQWGLQQVTAFGNKFAKNWVTIQPESMSFDEIKLLVATACFLEKQAQDDGDKVHST